MKVVPFNSETLKEAVNILKDGGVIAHPADTCYGLAADLMNPKAYEKIQEIKGRDESKPMSIMISVPEHVHMEKYVRLNDFSEVVVKKLFPSPVTLLLPKGAAIPDYYSPGHQLVGLRVPMHDLTQDLLRAFGGALITTSANCSGDKLCFRDEEVVDAFKNRSVQPDLIFEGEIKKYHQASTVIEVEDGHVTMWRKGPLTASYLESLLGVPVKERVD